MPTGVEVWQSGGVTLAAFDASRLGVWAQPIAGSNNTVPANYATALAQSGADVVLNGPMFGLCDSPPGSTEVQRYAASQCSSQRVSQLDANAGILLYGGDPSGEGMTIAVVNGAAVGSSGGAVPDGATVAIQLYPALVLAGQNVADDANTNAQALPRAGVAILADGRVAFAIGTMDMVGFASSLIAAGATDAGYTDGGGSTSLGFSDGTYHGQSEHRRVATWIIARPMTVLDAVGGPAGALVIAGVAVGLLALAWPQIEPELPTWLGGRRR